MKIPIFIIVHDRVEVLKKCVDSFQTQIKTPFEIIFHDVASTFPGCLDYLKDMNKKGSKIFRSELNDHRSVMNSVKRYLKDHPECLYYVITDPDIELDNVNGDILEFYISIIERYGKHNVVGPMLRIDDIPDFYPKKQMVQTKHNIQFWNKTHHLIKWKRNQYKIQRAAIDTTFQLAHRDNVRSFPRVGIRCYSPYSARHLDWYINPKNMTDDQKYYSKHASRVAHWGRNLE